MSDSFPSPTIPASSRTEVFLRYLDFFRSRVAAKIGDMPDAELRSSRLPSGWTPLELVKHLRYVELRWLEWGFEGRDVGDPWGDHQGDRWSVGPDETAATLLAGLRAQAARSRAVVEAHRLDEVASPVTAGTAQTRPPSSGSCSTCCRSTPGTSATWTSSPSSPPALGGVGNRTNRGACPGTRQSCSLRSASRSSPARTGSGTRPGPRSRCAAGCPAAGRPAACGRRPPRRRCRWRSGRRAAG